MATRRRDPGARTRRRGLPDLHGADGSRPVAILLVASRVVGDPRIHAVMNENVAAKSMMEGQHDGTGGTGANGNPESLRGRRLPVVRTGAGGT